MNKLVFISIVNLCPLRAIAISLNSHIPKSIASNNSVKLFLMNNTIRAINIERNIIVIRHAIRRRRNVILRLVVDSRCCWLLSNYSVLRSLMVWHRSIVIARDKRSQH